MKKLKALFSKENIFYTIAATLTFVVVVVNRAITGFDNILWIMDFGTIFTILYSICAAKHKRIFYIFNVIASCFIGASSIIQHLWLNAAVCFGVSIPSMIFGFIRWGKKEKQNAEEKNLNTLSKKQLITTIVIYAVTTAVFAIVLWLLDGNLFWLDAIYSAGCLVGVILASMAFIDQYYFFIFANFMGLILYILLSIQNINNLSLVATFLIINITTIMGFTNWLKLRKATTSQNSEDQKTEDAQTNSNDTKTQTNKGATE